MLCLVLQNNWKHKTFLTQEKNQYYIKNHKIQVRTLDSLEIRGPMSVSELSPDPSYWETVWRKREESAEKEKNIKLCKINNYKAFIINIDWYADWLTDWLIHWLTDWLNDRLIHWLTDWMTDTLTDWLSEWLGILVDNCHYYQYRNNCHHNATIVIIILSGSIAVCVRSICYWQIFRGSSEDWKGDESQS